jgi:predicted O-methyltransferase YrrM
MNSGESMSTATRWKALAWERVALGVRRYLGSWSAVVEYLVLNPLLRPEFTNRFARGTLSLKDELGYKSSIIPAKEVWELFPGIEEVEIRMGRTLPDEGSSISFREMVILCSIARSENARVVFEIGTSLGVTTFNIALNLPHDGVLHTLDLPLTSGNQDSISMIHDVSVSDRKMIFANRQKRRFLNSSVESIVHPLFSDSAAFDYSPYQKSCDIVFVDGAHSRAYVESDTKAAFALARPGGLVVWHDYNNGFFWPDVHDYLTRIAPQYGIKRIRGTMFAVARAS